MLTLEAQEVFIKNSKKSAVFENQRQIIAKQLFPIDKCEIVDLPKTAFGMRK